MLIFLAELLGARGAPLVRKYGNPSVRETLVLVTVRPYFHPSMNANVTPRLLAATYLTLDIHVMVN